MTSPKVSVCIPSYNAAPYISAAIDSALGQSFANFELVVSDDASTDSTPEICATYTDPRLRPVRSDERLGQAGNWNRCLELARGEYVILLHADDELLPKYLERAAGLLDTQKDVGLVHCAVEHIDQAGKPLEVQRLFQSDGADRDGVTLRQLLLDGCVVSPAGVMVRKTVYDAVGPFTDEIVWGVDWHMWIRIALGYPVAYLATALAKYREHDQSGTSAVMVSGRNARDEQWMFDDIFRLICRTRPDLCDLKDQAVRGIAHRTWCFAEDMCKRGDARAARTGLHNAVGIWPGMLAQPRTWALWLATYTGYRWFATAHVAKHRLTTVLRHRARSAG